MKFYLDQIYYVHQRPYSIRKVSKRFGGSGRVVREFSKEDRSIFSLKGCSLENQPMIGNGSKHPCREHDCAHLCFVVPSSSSDKLGLTKVCACKQGQFFNFLVLIFFDYYVVLHKLFRYLKINQIIFVCEKLFN